MSWKIYSLGGLNNAQNIANAVISQLSELGYTALYSNSGNTEGTLTFTIDGAAYSCILNVANTTSFPTYLLLNEETNEILICQTGRDTIASSQLCYIVNMALVRGTNAKTGEAGLFTFRTNQGAKDFTNWWGRFDYDDGQIYLQRAVFVKYAGTNVIVENSFVTDNLYWGTALYTPGATCAVGNDTFMCLNGCLFAKL